MYTTLDYCPYQVLGLLPISGPWTTAHIRSLDYWPYQVLGLLPISGPWTTAHIRSLDYCPYQVLGLLPIPGPWTTAHIRSLDYCPYQVLLNVPDKHSNYILIIYLNTETPQHNKSNDEGRHTHKSPSHSNSAASKVGSDHVTTTQSTWVSLHLSATSTNKHVSANITKSDYKCMTCGGGASEVCSVCKQAPYCSRECQVWCDVFCMMYIV